MFMRLGYVVGNCGVLGAMGILIAAQSITLATSFSMAAISTNTPVEEGGAYFLISRSLGPGLGGAIGIVLFFAQSLSIPFYIIGFVEAFVSTFPSLDPYFLWILLATGLLLFVISWVGADWAVKTQFVIFIILGLAIFAFLLGMGTMLNEANFNQNWHGKSDINYFLMFAIFFPAVTGIMSGVNMSGDLKNPSKSIPRGTFLAIGTATVVYTIQILFSGAAFNRVTLIFNPYGSLVENAIFKTGFLVTAGVFAATLSSAIGSFLGSPRILHALADDAVLPGLSPFKKVSGPNKEPRRALIMSMVLTLAVLFWAGSIKRDSSSGGGPLDIVAALVSMFFLYTYGMINIAAFVESFGKNPSFRPRFRYFHWSIALFGIASCFITSFLINSLISVCALLCVGFLFWFASKREREITFRDARRGFLYSRIRNNLLQLDKLPPDSKNWRPTIAVLTGAPHLRQTLLELAVRLGGESGITSSVEFMIGDLTDETLKQRENKLKETKKFIEAAKLSVFPEVIAAQDFDNALGTFLQSHSLAPIKPNIIMLGTPKSPERIAPFYSHLRKICSMNISFLIYQANEDWKKIANPQGKYINVVLKNNSNDSLLIVLAYLLQNSPGWKKLKIRLIRRVEKEEEKPAALATLKEMIERSRIDATAETMNIEDSLEVIMEKTKDAALNLADMPIPEAGEEEKVHFKRIMDHLERMPNTAFAVSAGNIDFSA
jgi:amino acid transporter